MLCQNCPLMSMLYYITHCGGSKVHCWHCPWPASTMGMPAVSPVFSGVVSEPPAQIQKSGPRTAVIMYMDLLRGTQAAQIPGLARPHSVCPQNPQLLRPDLPATGAFPVCLNVLQVLNLQAGSRGVNLQLTQPGRFQPCFISYVVPRAYL